MKIISGFEDYYDIISDGTGIIYNRTGKEEMGRTKELKYLSSIGVDTLKISQVRNVQTRGTKIVVYTDSIKHSGNGKIVTSLEEARLMYNNYLASEYIEDTDGYSRKYLQIGERRFELTFRKKDKYGLKHGDIVSTTELSRGYHPDIKIPIFSIDYIPVGIKMVATDFNATQNLGELGMEKYITKEEVVHEIEKALYRGKKGVQDGYM